MSEPSDAILADVAALHQDVDARFTRTTDGLPLHCTRGCADCCDDDLTVWEVEAAHLQAYVQREGLRPVVHAPGRCAWLTAEGACQVYPARPYVCRSQGAVMRWVDVADGQEQRATCQLHASLIPVAQLSLHQTFELGPAEERLLALATRWHARLGDKGLPLRVPLRGLAESLSERPK